MLTTLINHSYKVYKMTNHYADYVVTNSYLSHPYSVQVTKITDRVPSLQA